MDRSRRGRPARVVAPWALVLGGWIVAGCAGGSVASETPPTAAPLTLAPATGALPSGEPGQMPPMRDPIEVTGTVEAGVENGCVILRTETESYQLMGSTDPLLRIGSRVTVIGRPQLDIATTCQQGTPLQVLEVRVAD